MKRQWKQFIRRAEKKRLYESELSYAAVPWLLRYLIKSVKAGCKADVEEILTTLWVRHGIALDPNGNLCFVRDIQKDRH